MKGIVLPDFDLNTMRITDSRFGTGTLANLKKEEFADWVLECLSDFEIKDHHKQYWLRPDGRVLKLFCTILKATEQNPTDLIEMHAESYTLQQRTPRCLRRWKSRTGFFYPENPYSEGYKQKKDYWYDVY